MFDHSNTRLGYTVGPTEMLWLVVKFKNGRRFSLLTPSTESTALKGFLSHRFAVFDDRVGAEMSQILRLCLGGIHLFRWWRQDTHRQTCQRGCRYSSYDRYLPFRSRLRQLFSLLPCRASTNTRKIKQNKCLLYNSTAVPLERSFQRLDEQPTFSK